MCKKLIILILAISVNSFAQVPTNGLFAFYPFSGNANDISGHNYNGTVMGATLTTDRFGHPNSAYNFNGTSAYIDLNAYVSSFNFANPASISFWVWSTSDVPQACFSMNDGNNGQYGDQVAIGNGATSTINSVLFLVAHGDHGPSTEYIAGYGTSNRALLLDGNWHNIITVYDGISTKMFFDGVLYSLQCNYGTNDGSYGNLQIAQKLQLGTRWFSGSNGAYLHGGLDDVLVYNRVLTNSEILQIYNDSTNYSINSAAPTAANANPHAICPGQNSTLSELGGSLGTGATWYWYSGSCGGTIAGTGANILVLPTVTTQYFVRAEGAGNTTTCASTTLTVGSASTVPTSISGNSTICSGSSTTLTVNGGVLGSGASWIWFTGGCGGGYVSSGVTIVASPFGTVTYYVRGEGFCNTTSCVSLIVSVGQSSYLPFVLNASPQTVCSGQVVTLSFNGGVLGSGASWKWYSSSCGGTAVGTGNQMNISPMVSNIYFLRAEGACKTTICLSRAIYVNSLSISSVSLTATPQAICSGASITLSSSGGSLGTSAKWAWYSLSCGIISEGTGISLIVSPVASATYYQRAEGQCNTTGCLSIIVNVFTSSSPAVSATVSPTTSCPGNTITLVENGGSSGIGANWYWYANSCGGTYLMSGNVILQSPTTNTTYYVRAENVCNTTSCVSTTVTLNTASVPATSITFNSPVCPGTATTLNKNGGTLGTGGIWYWYSGGCGTTNLGANSVIIDIPTVTTTYFIRAEGLCNTTSCISATVQVYYPSTSQGTLISSQNIICAGNSVTLNSSGSSLGTGAVLSWFSGACGGNYLGTGTSIIQNPSSLTSYFVRAENLCNTTSCSSVAVDVYQGAISPTTITSNPSQICSGIISTLGFSGGSAGTSGIWKWYTGSCGGTPLATGTSIFVSPSSNTVYYLRAESFCNTTVCLSTSIYVTQTSVQASSISATYTTLCPGTSDLLALTGGSLGSGAIWSWYALSCGGTYIGSGVTLTVNPTVGIVYYARAEGYCNTTSCLSVSLTMNTPPVAPLIATTDRNNYCSSAGGNIVLTATGGSGDKVVWYRLSCGGTIVGTGNPKTIAAPTSSLRYWSRWETTGCTSSVCVSVGVNVLVSPTIPLAINPSSYTVCSNATWNITLSGSGGNGTSFGWYTGSCGGMALGTGRTFVVTSPTTTTTYWGRNQTVSCGYSSCRSVTISVVSSAPLQPDTIAGNINPSTGNTEVYRITNVPTIAYSWTAPSGWTGTSVSNSITYIVGGGSGVISVVPSNGCGTGPARTIDVNTGFNITGYFTYDNTTNTPLDSVWVFLKMNGFVMDSVRTDTAGYYHFNKKPAGIYNISATTHKPNASVNSTDAVKVKLHFSGTTLINSSIILHAADVNMSFNINITDAVKITRRYVGSDTSFSRGDWVFEKPTGGDTVNVTVNMNDTIIVSGGNVVQDFKGLCVGDVNGSNVPYQGAKSEAKVSLGFEGSKQLQQNSLLEIPFKINTDITTSAISLILNFPSKLINIADVRWALNDIKGDNGNNFIYNVVGNELRIAWFENNGPVKLKKGDVLFNIILSASPQINDGDAFAFKIQHDASCEFADENANPIERVDLSTYSLVYSKAAINSQPSNLDLNNFEVYPNPSSGRFTIRFYGDHQNASIKIYNTLGESILEYDSSAIKNKDQLETSILPEGVYFLKFVNGCVSVTRKLVVAE